MQPSNLRERFEKLAEGLTRSLNKTEWEQLRTHWSEKIPQRELEAVETPGKLAVALLEMKHISLSNIRILKSQLEAMGAEEGVKLCRRYEREAKELSEENLGAGNPVSVNASTVNDLNLVPPALVHQSHTAPETSQLHSGITTVSPSFSERLEWDREPVENDDTASFCLEREHQVKDDGCASARNLTSASPLESSCPQHNSPSSSVSPCQPEVGASLPLLTSLFSSSCKIRPNVDLDSGSGPAPASSRPDENSSLSQSSTETVRATFGNSLEPSIQSFSPLTSVPPNLHPMSGHESRPFQHSDQVLPGQDQFENGSGSQFNLQISATTTDYEEGSDWQPAATHLSLPEGPKLDRLLLVRNMRHTLRHQFTVALSVQQPMGNDWRKLAEKINISHYYIENWQQKNNNPAEQVLRSWQVKNEATVGRLYDLMIEMDREDLAHML
ncbi:uncharacterized protein LOC115098243 [Rhinatrema bivittatum]|uniref:uncharacterized protein LOC115098243 n=1 Tax=Rhinatrema bivittatum TaxID=194408 RepID=UPI00112BECFD|nr:uncharacterized protein LOC115098243 [Rhinatrema bivittatum]